ncbi:hypothetical protein BY458DRAFT_500306 [Sporodiniella umbellata]|nr:hypothetical protein BY458DRAFT_500306 [Sporodiniella umbellata]
MRFIVVLLTGRAAQRTSIRMRKVIQLMLQCVSLQTRYKAFSSHQPQFAVPKYILQFLLTKAAKKLTQPLKA